MILIEPALSRLDTIHPYIKATTDGITTAASMAWEVAFDGFICGRSTWFSRGIENLTHRHLPPATAKVASIFIQAAPHTALFFSLPALPFIGVNIICGIGRLFTRPEQANPVRDYDVGFALAMDIAGIICIAQGIMNRSIVESCIGVAACAVAQYNYSILGIHNAVGNCLDELTGILRRDNS